MTTLTISTDNHITAQAEVPAGGDSLGTFSSEKQLAKLTAGWPASRLADTWNRLAGMAPFEDLQPVRKFTSRKVAVARIWKAVERLLPAAEPQMPAVAPQVPAVAPEPPRSKKGAPRRQRRHTGPKGAKAARGGSKKAAVLDLLRRRPQGATLGQIMTATGWQAHTVRGFLSGALGKKMGLKVESAKREDGERAYRVAN